MMGLTTGDGLAVMSMCITLIVAIFKFVPTNKTPSANGSYQYLNVCNERHRSLDSIMARISAVLERLETDVRRLLIHAGLE